MTHLGNPTRPPRSLDDLLQSLPLAGGEHSEQRWQSNFEETMRRVLESANISSSVHGSDSAGPSHAGLSDAAVDDVLRTPLPVEAGEPEPSDPYAFDAVEGAEYDLLRAPLKSGEHAPFRFVDDGPSSASAADAQAVSAPLASSPAVANVSRYLLWGTTGIGLLAAAAALALFVRQSPSESELASELPKAKDAASVVDSPPVNAAEAAPRAKPLDDAVAVNSLPAVPAPTQTKEDATLEVATLDKQPARVATRVAVETTSMSQARSAAAAAPLKPAASHQEPQLVPAAGPSNLVDHPSTGAVSAALSRRIPDAQRCLPENVASTGVRITFQSDGSVRKVDVGNSGLDGSVRACLTKSLSSVRVEPFARTEFAVNATISRPPADTAR